METGTENTEQRSEGGEQTETEGTEIRPENGDPAEPEGECAGEEGMAETDGMADAEAEGVALAEPAEEPEKDAEMENDSQKAGMAEEDGSSGDPGIHADTGKEDGGNSGSQILSLASRYLRKIPDIRRTKGKSLRKTFRMAPMSLGTAKARRRRLRQGCPEEQRPIPTRLTPGMAPAAFTERKIFFLIWEKSRWTRRRSWN